MSSISREKTTSVAIMNRLGRKLFVPLVVTINGAAVDKTDVGNPYPSTDL